MQSLLERVEKLEKKFYVCGVCSKTSSKRDAIVATCDVPTKFICEKCVDRGMKGIGHSGKPTSQSRDECDFCGTAENITLVFRGRVNICEECIERCVQLIERHNADGQKEDELPIEERIQKLEFTFSWKMVRPENGFLFERNKYDSPWARWLNLRKRKSFRKEYPSEEELIDCVDRLEHIEE